MSFHAISGTVVGWLVGFLLFCASHRADARQMELTRMLSRSGLAQDLSRNMWQESTNLPLVQCDHPPNLHTLWRTKPDPTGPCWNSTWGTTPLHDRSTTPL